MQGVINMSTDADIPILVVDDQVTMRRIIKGMLRQNGYNNVDEAKDGQDALDKAKNTEYKLIISDWNMEPMNGLDFLKNIRTQEQYKSTPFLMVTAESKTENVLEAKKAGVDNYIVKPFNAVTLQGKIKEIMP